MAEQTASTKDRTKIPLSDIYLSSFQALHGNEPEIITQGTRAVFLFNADDTFYVLSERYNKNEAVNVADFVNALRRIRSRMLTARRGQ